jgi:hypothetical protein
MNLLFIVLALIIVVYFLLYKYISYKKEALCIAPSKCGTTELENVLNYDYTTEPNNPFYTHEMVVPKLPSKYSGENVKNRYLENANKVYSEIDNDILNAALVPKPGLLFVYP